MKKIIYLSVFSFFILFNLTAQSSERAEVILEIAQQTAEISTLKNNRTIIRSKAIEIPLQKVNPFLAYSITYQAENLQLWIRFSENGEDWENWQSIKKDAHEEANEQWVSELMYADKKYQFYQYQWRIDSDNLSFLPQLSIHFYSPGTTQKPATTTTNNSLESRSCPCPQPAFEARTDWCPNGDCPKDSTPAPNQVTHLVVHHSAGTNLADDWAAIVRSIWDFHVNTRGWDDVGYNWLIDPNGIVYEGRGADLIGAHFCGTNTGTEGVCLLGNFTAVAPSQTAVNGLVRLLAWKSCSENLYPIDRITHAASGKNLLQVSGHRDGCNTSCPGDSFYPLFDDLRAATIEYIDNYCNVSSLISAPYALKDSLIELEKVQLNWLFDLPSSSIQLSLERSVGEDFRYEEIARFDSDVNSYQDEDIDLNQLYFYRLRAITENEASAYSNKTMVSTIVSNINQYLNTKSVQLFPNPVSNTLFVEIENQLKGQVLVELQDLSGKQIKSYSFEKPQIDFEAKIPVENLPKGMYLLKIEQEQERIILKITKQ